MSCSSFLSLLQHISARSAELDANYMLRAFFRVRKPMAKMITVYTKYFVCIYFVNELGSLYPVCWISKLERVVLRIHNAQKWEREGGDTHPNTEQKRLKFETHNIRRDPSHSSRSSAQRKYGGTIGSYGRETQKKTTSCCAIPLSNARLTKQNVSNSSHPPSLEVPEVR